MADAPPLASILLIDDDPINNFLNERLLRRLGIASQLLVAESGEAALALLSKPGLVHPDLLLLDVNMPGLTGIEFLTCYHPLRLVQHPVPVIVMLTTTLDDGDLHQLGGLHVDGLISKPLTEAKVRLLLEEHFSQLHQDWARR